MSTDSPIVSEIVDAAKKYFLQFGYSRVSTDEIVKSIGRSKKTLYKHFETKEALLQAVLQRINQDIEADLVEQFQADDPATYHARLETILTKVGIHCASTSGVLFADLKTRSAEVYEQSHRFRQEQLIALLHRFIEQGRAAGQIRADAPIEQILTVFLTSAENLASPLDIAQAAGKAPALIDTLVQMTVASLR